MVYNVIIISIIIISRNYQVSREGMAKGARDTTEAESQTRES